MNISGIYQIKSKAVPCRIYIGSSIDIYKRWKYHLRNLRNNKHHSVKLQRHYNKYGLLDLQFTILIGCDVTDLIKNEQYFIDAYNPYFNGSKKAINHGPFKQSDEAKRKISEAFMGEKNPNYGRVFSEEHRRKIGDSRKGKTHSEETRHKISIKNKGLKKPKSEDHKKKLSEANKGKKMSDETKDKLSKVLKGKNTWSKGRKNPHVGIPCSEETKAKKRLISTGKKHTEESKNKMSEIRKEYYKNKREVFNINLN